MAIMNDPHLGEKEPGGRISPGTTITPKAFQSRYRSAVFHYRVITVIEG